jgi:hypothetical protein
LVLIIVCGEAVSALRLAGILPAAGNKGKMPSPHEDGASRTSLAERLCLHQHGQDHRHQDMNADEQNQKDFHSLKSQPNQKTPGHSFHIYIFYHEDRACPEPVEWKGTRRF